jgi:hypothetical protein
MFTAWQNKGTIFLCIIFLVVGVFIGKTFYSKTEVQIVEKPVKITETVKVKGDTTVEYVEKEVVKYLKEDGSVGEKKEQTDVQADIGQPKVSVKVNNQPYQFSLLQGETQKFEQGKIVLSQNSEISLNLDVQPQIIDRTKSGGLWFGAGSRGANVALEESRILAQKWIGKKDWNASWQAVQW